MKNSVRQLIKTNVPSGVSLKSEIMSTFFVQRPPGNTGVPIPMFATRTVDIQLPFKGFDAGFPLQAERKNAVGWNLKIPPDPLLS
jgi:hypothetical protein